jgi:uncharacterized protein YqjF (DUF2071 family)
MRFLFSALCFFVSPLLPVPLNLFALAMTSRLVAMADDQGRWVADDQLSLKLHEVEVEVPSCQRAEDFEQCCAEPGMAMIRTLFDVSTNG